MTTADIKSTEFPNYFKRYIDKVSPETELRTGLADSLPRFKSLFEEIPEEKMNHRYAPNKWSLKEVLQHIVDTERVFSYRLFRIGRGDQTPLSSFDQDKYIQPSRADQKSKGELLDEYEAVRRSTISLANSLSDKDWKNIGTSSNHPMSARALAFIILGHEIWHCDIIQERYMS